MGSSPFNDRLFDIYGNGYLDGECGTAEGIYIWLPFPSHIYYVLQMMWRVKDFCFFSAQMTLNGKKSNNLFYCLGGRILWRTFSVAMDFKPVPVPPKSHTAPPHIHSHSYISRFLHTTSFPRTAQPLVRCALHFLILLVSCSAPKKIVIVLMSFECKFSRDHPVYFFSSPFGSYVTAKRRDGTPNKQRRNEPKSKNTLSNTNLFEIHGNLSFPHIFCEF